MRNIVISSMGRTGSTMIAQTLIKHPAILGFTEIFHHEEEKRKACHAQSALDDGLFAYQHHEYARPDLYLDFLEAMAALKGKRLLSYKLMESQCPAAYMHLPSRNAVIINTYRDNYLEAVASFKIACATGVWNIRHTEDRGAVLGARVTVDVEELQMWELRDIAHSELIKRTGLPFYCIDYLRIASNPKATLKALFDFIEVAPCEIPPAQIKLNARPIHDMVSNYEQLQAKLKGTKFAWMAR